MRRGKASSLYLFIASFFLLLLEGGGRKDGGERCVLTGADMAERTFGPKPRDFSPPPPPSDLQLALCVSVCCLWSESRCFFFFLGPALVLGSFHLGRFGRR